MNVFHLKYFLDAVRFGGVAASAEQNRITHSAVSQSIRALEQEMGITLITHERRKFILTEDGKQLFDKGTLWLQNLEVMKNEIKNSRDELSGELTIVAPQSLIREAIWKNLIKFRKNYPRVKLKIMLGTADYVKALVGKGRADLGFIIDDSDLGGLQSLTLSSGKYVVISKDRAAKPIDKQLLVSGKQRYEVQRICEGLRRLHKRSPEIAFEIQSWSLIRQFVRDAGYVGVVPEYTVSQELQRGQLHALKLGFEEPHYEIKAVWLSANDLQPKVKAFLRMLA